MNNWIIIIETTTTKHTIHIKKGTKFGDWLNFMDDVIYNLMYKNDTIEPYEEVIDLRIEEE